MTISPRDCVDAAARSNAEEDASSYLRLHLYIYYRALPENTAAVIACVSRLQHALRGRQAVRCGLLRRPDESSGQITWMENYLDIFPGFVDTLNAAVAEAGLSALIEGVRHTEYFQECLPCT
ncbi:MAG: DUF4936 family protein [Pseudomonadota bacterium]